MFRQVGYFRILVTLCFLYIEDHRKLHRLPIPLLSYIAIMERHDEKKLHVAMAHILSSADFYL